MGAGTPTWSQSGARIACAQPLIAQVAHTRRTRPLRPLRPPLKPNVARCPRRGATLQNFENTILGPYGRQIELIRTAVRQGALAEGADIYEYLLSRPSVYSKRSRFVFPSRSPTTGADLPLPFISVGPFMAAVQPQELLAPATVEGTP